MPQKMLFQKITALHSRARRILHGAHFNLEVQFMTNGTVKYFNPSEGYGLISTDSGAADVAVYQSEVNQARLGQLAPGQKLSFNIALFKARPKAVDLWATFGDR